MRSLIQSTDAAGVDDQYVSAVDGVEDDVEDTSKAFAHLNLINQEVATNSSTNGGTTGTNFTTNYHQRFGVISYYTIATDAVAPNLYPDDIVAV